MSIDRILPILLLACGLVAACSDDKDPKPSSSVAGSASTAGKKGLPDEEHGGDPGVEESGGAAGGDAGAAGESAVEPLYVVSTGVISGDDFLGYLVPVHSLEKGGTFDLDKAAEVGGGSFVFNRPGDPAVYVASLYDPTIVRWEVKGDGEFVKRETLSFANLGIVSASGAALAPIFSATKSYFTDEEQDQIIIWNPEKMELIDTIALGDENVGNLRPIPEGTILVHDDKLVVTIGWRDADNTTLLGDHLRIVTIDTNTDQIVDSKLDDRNVHVQLNSTTSDGTAYFSNYSLYAAYTEIGAGHGSPSTALRILPGQQTFDPDFALDLSQLVGGRPAGDYTLLDDETALIRAWHPEIVDEVDPEDWQAVLWNEAGFKWWRWHVGDEQAVEIEHQEPGAQGSTIFKLDGKTYTIRYADDLSTTELIEITPQGEFVPGVTATGAIIGSGVLRIH